MVNYNASELNSVFSALSDPTRRAILQKLSQKQETVSALAEPFAMSLPAVSKHLKVLERAYLIRRKKVGKYYAISLNPKPLEKATDWLGFYKKFWKANLSSLQTFLEKNTN